MIRYGFSKEVDAPFERAVTQVAESLKEHGFGILTQIDVRQKFKEKLGIDFQKYVILGACDPAHAHQVILAEPDIGLMLPCNVIVYEKDGKTIVSSIKPTIAMQAVGNPQLKEIAQAVEARLAEVIAAL